MVDTSVSGIGVLDKAVRILDALESGAATLAELSERTALPRATAHRLAVALEQHGFVERDDGGRFVGGRRLAVRSLADAALPALERLREATGESVQLFVRRGAHRVCLVSLESPHSLRTIVAVGATLPMDRGSAAKALAGGVVAESVEEREKGVASVSAPVHDAGGDVAAAVSVSGPVERTTRAPARKYAKAVARAAREVEAAIGAR
ncbi:MAG TPA: helix-turn-helix domain-containing protein [Acidimicrobiales bacterium]